MFCSKELEDVNVHLYFSPLLSPGLSCSLLSQPFQPSLAFPRIFFAQLHKLLKMVGCQSLTSHQLHVVEGCGDKNRSQWQISFSKLYLPVLHRCSPRLLFEKHSRGWKGGGIFPLALWGCRILLEFTSYPKKHK